MTVKLHQTVSVEWEDAWSNSGRYFDAESIKREPKTMIRCVGFLIQNDKQGVTLALEQHCADGDTDYRSVHHIPRSLIRKIKVLR